MRTAMSCIRCMNDPQPPHFHTPRRCAFDTNGSFTQDNWNCATMNLLAGLTEKQSKRQKQWASPIYGEDESMEVVWCGGWDVVDSSGWIVLTRYKTRGCCSSAIHSGDFWPTRPLTLELANKVIAYWELQDDKSKA